jgi:hypothetical protein
MVKVRKPAGAGAAGAAGAAVGAGAGAGVAAPVQPASSAPIKARKISQWVCFDRTIIVSPWSI